MWETGKGIVLRAMGLTPGLTKTDMMENGWLARSMGKGQTSLLMGTLMLGSIWQVNRMAKVSTLGPPQAAITRGSSRMASSMATASGARAKMIIRATGT